MDLEWTLSLCEIAEGETAQALAHTLRVLQQAPAIATPFQAEGGKDAAGTKDLAFPAAQAAHGDKGGPVERLPRAAAAQGAKPPPTRLPQAAMAQGTKNPG
jgi:hypothetical protein